jgi:hypothetical protein
VGFLTYLAETRTHVQRREQVFRMHVAEIKAVDCPAIDKKLTSLARSRSTAGRQLVTSDIEAKRRVKNISRGALARDIRSDGHSSIESESYHRNVGISSALMAQRGDPCGALP